METSRNSRATLGPIGILLLILGMIFGTRIPSGSGKGEEKTGPSEGTSFLSKSGGGERKGTSGPDFLQPYQEFRRELPGPDGISSCLDSSPASRRLGKLLAQDVALGQIAPEFLIVTLPDPIDSRVGYAFDTITDAVQMAVEARGWELDRFWLPWWPSGRPLRVGAELKPVEVPGSGSEPSLQERQPGLLLFRQPKHPCQPQQLLLVFLVGETPTSGIAKAALVESIEAVRTFFKESPLKAHQPLICRTNDLNVLGLLDLLSQMITDLVACRSIDVKILGPYFSGSQTSVLQVVQSFRQGITGRDGPPLHFRFRSGSADRVDVDTFRKAGCVDFDATVLHFDTVLWELCKYLRDKEGANLDKVALLTESDTTFGQFSNGQRSLFDKKKDLGVALTQMKFPFHISQLAAATKTADRAADQGSAELVRPSSRMTIPFGDTGAPRDAVPSLAAEMSNVTSEFVLSKIFETISRERFRYIGIVATDPRDTIFLASQIRTYCPDVQLFSIGGDIMLSHPRYTQQLGGMLVGSCYPLFSMAQRWDQPPYRPNRRHQFASQEEEGVYNAAFSLLRNCDLEGLYDYAPPFDEMECLHDLGVKPHPNNRNTCPGVWLSVVGARGLWPIHFKEAPDCDKCKSYTFRTPAEGPAPCCPEKERKASIKQFLALVPEITWAWCALVLGLTVVVWVLYWNHVILDLNKWDGSKGPCARALSYLRPLAGKVTEAEKAEKKRIPWREIPERFQVGALVFVGLLTLAFTYGYVVLLPCWIAYTSTPWVKLYQTDDTWKFAGAHDQLNLYSLVVVFVVGHVTFFALMLTVLRRTVLPVLWDGLRSVLTALWNGLKWLSSKLGERKKATGTASPPTEANKQQADESGAGEVAPTGGEKNHGPANPQPVAQAQQFEGLNKATSWIPVVLEWLLLLSLALSLYALLRFGTAGAWDGTDWVLFWERAVNIASGVSPFVPVTILSLVLALWLWCHARGIHLGVSYWGNGEPVSGGDDYPLASRRINNLRGLHQEVRRLAFHTTLWGSRESLWWRVALLLPALVLFRLWQGLLPPVDSPGGRWTLVIFAAIWFLGLTVFLDLGRFVLMWGAISRLLRAFAALPMSRAFDRIPRSFSRSFGRYLDRVRPTTELLAIPVQQLTVVAESFVGVYPDLETLYQKRVSEGGTEKTKEVLDRIFEDITGLTGEIAKTRDELKKLCTIQARGEREKIGREVASSIMADYREELDSAMDRRQSGAPEIVGLGASKTWKRLRKAALGCLELLEVYWATVPPASAFVEPGSDESKQAGAGKEAKSGSELGNTPPDPMKPVRDWLRSAEDLLALQVVCAISRCTIPLSNLVIYLAVAPLLLLLTISTYPVQPQRLLQICYWGLLLAVLLGVIWVYVSRERDELLSRVSGTTPNAITFDREFLGGVMAFVTPILALVLAQFPFFSDLLHHWFEPLGRILR
jgi:hypothetical protein